MSDLGGELLVSLAMTAGMILLHMSGLMLLTRLTRLHLKLFRTGVVALDSLLVPLGIGVGLFALHGLEVWGYAWLFEAKHAIHGWEQAIFLSAGAYSTAGWMGVQPADGWRVAAVLESVTGMLLMGWSTAFLFQTLHRILQTEDSHPLPEGAIRQGIDQEDDDAGAGAEDGKDSPRPSRSGSGAPSGTNSSDTELMQ